MTAALIDKVLPLLPTTECVLWPGCVDRNGYGKTWKGSAHGLLYRVVVGPVPEGLQLDHLCRNKACVNPAHLEPVTQAENLRRGREVRSGRPLGPDDCMRGHPLGDIQGDGYRHCRICAADRERRRRAASRGGDAITNRP